METNEQANSKAMATAERVTSVLSGAAILFQQFKRKKPASKIKVGIAGYLIYRGIAGHCPISSKLGLGTSTISALTKLM